MNILKEYLSEKKSDPKFLDKVSTEFADQLISLIHEKFIIPNVSDIKSQQKLRDNLSKLIKVEYNTLKVPYFYILENINLCVEVEMSINQVDNEKTRKFGEMKFSQIMESGMPSDQPIKRFAISEKKFFDGLVSFIERYTPDYEVGVDSIKIEFN